MVFGFFETSSHDDDEKQELRRQQQHHHHSTTASVSVRRHETTANSTTTSPSSNNNNSSKAVRNSFIAGWTAGVTGTLAGHPLDSLKVWVQTGIRPAADHVVGAATTATAGSPSPASILATVRRFYAGVSGPVVTVGLIQSINFAVYDTTRRFWYYHMDNPTTSSSTSSGNHIDPYGPHQRDYLNQDSYTSVAVSGMAAGAVLSVVTAPILMIKTLQQTQRNMSFRDALRWTRRHPTTGFGVHFAVETLNRAVYFCTYEYLKRYFEQPPPPSKNINDKEQYHDGDDDATTTTTTMSLSGRMISAAAAGINCWAWLYPIDALRSRIYANMAAAADAAPISSGWAMAKIMYAEGGWRSFYRGFAITTLRAGPVAAAILPVYDYTLDALNNHNNNNNSTTF